MSCVSDKQDSGGTVMDRKCPAVSNMAGDMAQSSSTSMMGYTASTSSVVESHRRQQVERVRQKFGEYGEPLMVGEYKEFKMTFDSGCPAMFWLHAATEAIQDLQTIIQRKLRGKPSGDGGGNSGVQKLLNWLYYHRNLFLLCTIMGCTCKARI
eukprot:GFUD01136662.1.p1 GENE.GFUD01136662.1~~GFUD01136662.1.p1  ORF type:complete len:153 (-),score=31.14 GFUD01136662.1:18-476(-)